MPSSMPILFIWSLIAIFIFRHHMKKSSKKQDDVSKKFWAKEASSLVVRKKELTQDDYVYPNLTEEDLKGEAWFEAQGQKSLYRYEKQIAGLLKQPMMNFQSMSNTDLRLTFGTANLTIIRENEERWNSYLKALYQIGSKLLASGETLYSIKLLEEGIAMGTDNRQHFLALGRYYKDSGNTDAFHRLLTTAQSLESLTKNALVRDLKGE